MTSNIDAEFWEAVYASTEDSLRNPRFKHIFFGSNAIECVQKAIELESQICEYWVTNQRGYEDGGLPFLYSIHYLGVFGLDELRGAEND